MRDLAAGTAPLTNGVIRSERKSYDAVGCDKGSSNASGTDNEENSTSGNNGLEFEGNAHGVVKSSSHASGHGKDRMSSIPVSNAEYDGHVSLNEASVQDGAVEVDGITSGVQTSRLCSDTAEHGELGSGDKTASVSNQTGCTSVEEVLAASTTPSATECVIGSFDQDEVRCSQCNKVQPPQRCPVCKLLCISLPSHIGTHSGKNPYTISSLLGMKTTYIDGDLQPVKASGHAKAENGGDGGAAPRPRKRKKRRVPQQCTVCGHTYTKLAQHMARMHSDGDPCMCPDCGKFLRNANTLRAHMLSKTCHKSRICPICERTCENDAGLKSHMRSHAALYSSEDGPPVDGMKDYHCDECGHAFSSSEALESHLALHASGKHHVCCVCGRSFIHARSLRLHLRMHTGETPFECKVCGKGFRSRNGLSEHQSVHTMEKRYGCMVCGRRFRLRRTFSRHLVLHSGVKRFSCRECGMRFAFSHLWKRHMRTHSGEKPYICGDCGEQFTQWNGLDQHRQRRCGREPPVPSLGLF